MIIYKDVFTKDELFSDAFKISESEDGLFYIVEGKSVTRTQDGIDESLIGGNASAEDVQEQTTDSSSVSGIDIVLNHNLVSMALDKKGYMSHLKDYMSAIRNKLTEESGQERADNFKEKAKPAVTEILKKFKDYELYSGQSTAPEGTLGLLNWHDDVSPYMMFFKDGIEIEKF